jgi:uracil-DNA glycosylase
MREIVTAVEEVLTRALDGGNRLLSIAPLPPDSGLLPGATSGIVASSENPEAVATNALTGDAALAGDSPDVTQPQDDGAPPRPVSGYATLEALQFAFRDCQACKLASTRHRLVFGTGPNHPKIMFIGEGPGAEEDAQGLPFVGRAGALLIGFISALGLTRADVYITNVVKCRPPGNRTPEPDEVASCRPILQRQIELLNPQLIVTLGNVPLKALNPRAAGITKERGRPFSFLEWTVLPTFHPSYLLRNPSDIPTCWLDFRRVFRETYSGS